MGRKLNAKKIFGDLISFGSPQAIAINIFFIFLFLIMIPTSTFENQDSFCIFKNFLIPVFFDQCPQEGIFEDCECPACGLTRASSYLLHGNIDSALEYNRGVIPLILTMLIVWIKNLIQWLKIYKKEKVLF